MKEKYSPIIPLKKGVEVTGLITKTVYEAVKPYYKRRLINGVARILRVS